MAKSTEAVPTIESRQAQMLEDGDDVLHLQELDENGDYVDLTKPAVEDTTAPDVKERDSEVVKEDIAPEATEEEDDIPAHLKGKTAAQIAKMYADLHSVVGRQGKELGELRSLADSHLKASLAAETARKAREAAPAAPTKKALEDADFFAKPKDAIDEAIANHPAIQRLNESEQRLKAQQVAQTMQRNKEAFEKAHPDAGEVLADPNFQAWIAASPIRQRMLRAADQNYDFAAGNEIFSTYKEIKAARATAAAPAASAAKVKANAAKAAARVPTGGNSSPAQKGGGTSDKVFRRADLIRLQLEDPQRYEDMGREIEKAYQEGRVR